MFSKVELAKKTEFLDKTKVAREERANERQRDLSAVIIQARRLSVEFWCLFSLLKFRLWLVRKITKRLR